MNRYKPYLKQLPSAALRSCLALVCCERGYALGLPSKHMESLEDLDLVQKHLLGWKPTWLGHGVNNWRRQLEASLFRDPTLPIPEPVENENGQDLAPECQHYRELYYQPGVCWCLRPARLHPGHLVQLAADFLSWHNENERTRQLQLRGSGRSLAELLPQLTSLERTLLNHATACLERPPTLGELAVRYSCLADFFSLKVALDHLQELELADNRAGLLLTWDGRGLCRWMAESELARQRGFPHSRPAPGENGVDPLPSPCLDFRALLTEPGICWCGWHIMEHRGL